MSGFEISPVETYNKSSCGHLNVALFDSISFRKLKIAIVIAIVNPLFTQFIDPESLTAISQLAS